MNSVDKDKPMYEPIPDFLKAVTERMNKLFEKTQGPFDQLTVNDYSPGDGIAPHFDVHSPFEETFVALSLGSGLAMQFKS